LPRTHAGAILGQMNRVAQFLTAAISLAALSAACALPLRADDLKLKDGTKITGDIVGFDDNSFKVKTSYGFALVQKDQVVSISISEAPKVAAEKKLEPTETKSPAPEKPKPEPGVASPASAPAQAIAVDPASRPTSPNTPASPPMTAAGSKTPSLSAPPPMPNPVATSEPAASSTTKSVAASAPATAAAPVVKNPAPATPDIAANAAPPKPSGPEPFREQVTGNTYTNETYRFHMYKPPDWDVIASAPAVLPGAITAMGTADDTTYLLIGQEATSKTLAAEMDATEHRLRDVMANFRPLGEEKVTVSGTAAMEHHFRGSVDQHDWSGVVVLVPRGEKVYTIFGMTRADNDLFQLQENVISRAIASLQFTN